MSDLLKLRKTFPIAGKGVGEGSPCLVVAEVAQAHDGDIDVAHQYIDSVAESGADAIKFQTHIASAESTAAEPWRVKFSDRDKTRYDYWKRMEFSAGQWKELFDHAGQRELLFLSSPFSEEAVDLLEGLGLSAWKIGAGEITNLPLLEYIGRTKKPVMLSNGLATWDDLDRAIASASAAGSPIGIYQCTSAYPCGPEKIGLNVLQELRDRYHCPVGLSDHSGTIYAGLAAAALGADMLELHVKLSPDDQGPDAPASVTTEELKKLVEGIRFIDTALAHPASKSSLPDDMIEMRRIFGKSVVAARDLPAGHPLSREDLACKKPGTGIPAAQLGEVLNRKLKRAVSADTLLSEDDFE